MFLLKLGTGINHHFHRIILRGKCFHGLKEGPLNTTGVVLLAKRTSAVTPGVNHYIHSIYNIKKKIIRTVAGKVAFY
jgi:hypothetical protein